MQLYPGILTDSADDFQNKLNLVKDNDHVETIHVDIIDGLFADNLTLTPTDLINLDFGNLTLQFHLMVEHPLDLVHELTEHDNQLPIKGVIAQVERMDSQDEFLELVRKRGWRSGLSLDLYTPTDAIDKTSLDKLDIIQVMSVKVGFQGQTFQPAALEKIRQIVQLRDQREIEIIVDGGIRPENSSPVIEAGADSLEVGSVIWKSKDIKQTLEELSQS